MCVECGQFPAMLRQEQCAACYGTDHYLRIVKRISASNDLAPEAFQRNLSDVITDLESLQLEISAPLNRLAAMQREMSIP